MKVSMLLFVIGLAPVARAADLSVIDVRRNITLSETDPVYKDFYIGGDAVGGLKKNMVVTVVRKLNIRDSSGANSFGEIQVPVGQLKVIAVFDKIAVAREFTLLSRDELPMLEQIGIMSGDRVETKGSFIDTTKPKKRALFGGPADTTAPPAAPAAAPVSPTNLAADNKAQAILSTAPAATGEKLEKVGDSDNTSTHE